MEIPPEKKWSPEEIDGGLKLMLSEGRVIFLPSKRDTASMLPTLHPGQKVAVAQAGELLERGDLLLFRQVGERVVHRYLGPATDAAGAPCLRTRGDNNPTLDAPLDPAQVLGRVIAIERDGEWLELDSTAARLYGLGAALHDLFWAVAAHAAGKLDGWLGRPDGGLRERVVAWDRGLLAAAHRLYLRFARRREGSGAASGRAGSKPGPGAPGRV